MGKLSIKVQNNDNRQIFTFETTAVRYRVKHSKRNSKIQSNHVLLCLFDTFDDNFSKDIRVLSENYPKLVQMFPHIFQRSEDVFIIHQQFLLQLKGQTWHQHYIIHIIAVKHHNFTSTFLRAGNCSFSMASSTRHIIWSFSCISTVKAREKQ